MKRLKGILETKRKLIVTLRKRKLLVSLNVERYNDIKELQKVRQEIVESHDSLYPEGMLLIKDKQKVVRRVFFYLILMSKERMKMISNFIFTYSASACDYFDVSYIFNVSAKHFIAI